jgi:predicted ArsR family transcriptional regulator
VVKDSLNDAAPAQRDAPRTGGSPYNPGMDKRPPAATGARRTAARMGPAAGEPAYRALGGGPLSVEEGLDQLADAIRDPTRRRILVSFYGDPSPRTAYQVADDVGISRPVARTHLELLRATGFLRHEPRRGFRGKPAHLYSLATDSSRWMPHPPRQMALLALLVLEAASLGPDRVRKLVEQVGQDYGRTIRDFRPAGSGTDRPVEMALAPLRLLGEAVDIEAAGRTRSAWHVRLKDLLFAEAAPGRTDLLAALHLGIVRSLVEETGLDVTLDPEPAPESEAIEFRIKAPGS